MNRIQSLGSGVRWCGACERILDRDPLRRKRRLTLAYFVCRVCRQAFSLFEIYEARAARRVLPLRPTTNQPLRRVA